MKIVADENIPLVESIFEPLGTVTKIPGRNITSKDLMSCEVLLVRSVTQVNKRLLAGTPVRFVGTATSGVDHIEIKYLHAQELGFADAKGCNAWSVAEYVMSAIAFWCQTKQHKPEQISVGIVGYGHVGKKVKRLCDYFSIPNVVCDPPLSDQGHQFDAVPFAQACQCDVITLHVPLELMGKHPTRDLINENTLKMLHSKQLLINTSRGEVVNENALLKITETADLILDVWRNEPNINPNLLAKTLLGTPHIAGYSYEGKIRGTLQLYHACCDFFNLQPQQHSFNVSSFPAIKAQHQAIKTLQDILQQYDITADNHLLKQILLNKSLNSGNYFDHLRKNYRKRKEWHPLIL